MPIGVEMTPENREKIRGNVMAGTAEAWDAGVLWRHVESLEKRIADLTLGLDAFVGRLTASEDARLAAEREVERLRNDRPQRIVSAADLASNPQMQKDFMRAVFQAQHVDIDVRLDQPSPFRRSTWDGFAHHPMLAQKVGDLPKKRHSVQKSGSPASWRAQSRAVPLFGNTVRLWSSSTVHVPSAATRM